MSKHLTKFKEMNQTHVSSKNKRIVYRGFFSVEEHELSYQKFNKNQSDVVIRSALISSEAVIVLPYDPINDRVLLIEQFRTGPYVKGDKNPWVLEPIAGLVDDGETPELAGVREAQEEANLKIANLELVARSYPSPGISTEFFHQYVGIASLPESTSLITGLSVLVMSILSSWSEVTNVTRHRGSILSSFFFNSSSTSLVNSCIQ